MAKLVFVNSVAPYWGIQSGPVLFRHLERARAGWEVICVHFSGTPPTEFPVQAIRVPDRRPGWPPVRRWLPGSEALRSRLLLGWARTELQLCRDDRIVCVPSGAHHEFACRLSQATGAGLVVILHDLWGATVSSRDIRRTFSHARCVAAVSEELAGVAKQWGARETRVVIPIGEPSLGDIQGEQSSSEIVVGVAGSVSKDYIDAALLVGDRAIVLSDPIEGCDQRVRFVPRFAKNRDALEFLARNCHALVVYQSYEPAANWVEYSFPSRLIDFAQTGLPLVVLAPPHATAARWAHENNWPLLLSDPFDVGQIERLRLCLSDPSSVAEVRKRVCGLRDGIFAPERIHEELEAALRI